MTAASTENRIFPRNRAVSPAERARGLKIARAAEKLTREMARFRSRVNSLSRQRDKLLHEAATLGITRQELAQIIGTQRKVVDDALTRARQ